MIIGIIVLLVTIAPRTGDAHTRSESWSRWYSDAASVRAVLTIRSHEVTRLPLNSFEPQYLSEAFASYAAERIVVHDADGPCPPPQGTPLRAAAGFVRVEVRAQCAGEAQSIVYGVFFDLVPSHVHFVRFGADADREAILSDDHRRFEIDSHDSRGGGTFRQYFALGLAHIALGYDHLAFLAAMLLVAGRWRRVLLAVTGFTVGHSLSLALAVTGSVKPIATTVEAFIGFTVALVAAERTTLAGGRARIPSSAAAGLAIGAGLAAYLLGFLDTAGIAAYGGIAVFAYCYLNLSAQLSQRAARTGLLAAAAMAFGLIHGFGFAGFLIATGLPTDNLVPALFGFNLGVEAGQVGIVLLVLVFAGLCRRIAGTQWATASDAIAATLCGIGIFWFVTRTFPVSQ